MLNFAFICFYPRRVWHFKKKISLVNYPECFLLGLIPCVLLWLLLELQFALGIILNNAVRTLKTVYKVIQSPCWGRTALFRQFNQRFVFILVSSSVPSSRTDGEDHHANVEHCQKAFHELFFFSRYRQWIPLPRSHQDSGSHRAPVHGGVPPTAG